MPPRKILLFTKTSGYRHASITDGVELVLSSASGDDVVVDHTEDEAAFESSDLNQYDAIIWLQVSGDVLSEAGRLAFDNYLRAGGGFAGIHGAADAEWSWPAYESIVGARFLFHPLERVTETATVIAEASDLSTDHIPQPWAWQEEWYAFKRNPRGEFTILLRIDESTYHPETEPMGDDHPVSWRGRYGQGHTWYTALGHAVESYSDPIFREHIWGGIKSVMRP